MEKAEELADARRREGTRLPGTKRRAAESARETALVVAFRLGLLPSANPSVGE